MQLRCYIERRLCVKETSIVHDRNRILGHLLSSFAAYQKLKVEPFQWEPTQN